MLTIKFKTKKILLIFIVLDILLFLFGSFVFWNVQKVNKETISLTREVTLNTKREMALGSVLKMLNDTKSSIDSLQTFFVGSDSVVVFIEKVENLARNVGVKLVTQNVAEDDASSLKDDFKKSLKLKVSVSGSWKNILKLTALLENLPYKISLDNITISSDGAIISSDEKLSKTNTTPTWSGVLELSVLKLK